MTYHMSKEEVTLSKLQGLLRTIESGLKSKAADSTPTATLFLEIGRVKGKRGKLPQGTGRESLMMDLLLVDPKVKPVLHLPLLIQKKQHDSTTMKRGIGSEAT